MPLPPDFESRAFLLSLFEVARKAADPAACVPAHLPPKPKGRTIVVGAGKAAAAMARAVEENWGGDLEGLVVTRYGHGVPTERIEVVEAAHPVPDAAGRAAAERMLALAEGLGPDDLLLCLISGGGSALLAIAHWRGRLSVDEAWAAATVDETWQREQWGRDAEAEAHAALRRAEFEAASRCLRLLRSRR